MESEFYCKVAHAVAGMKKSEANELAKLLSKYEKDLNTPSKGKKYQESYDLKLVSQSKNT